MSTQQPSVTQPSDEQPDDRSVSRRNFLSAGGATAVATGLGGRLQPAFAAEQPRRKVPVGIAGGNFGATFQFHEHPDCIVEAVTDLIPSRRERLMKTYRCEKSYESLEKMVLDDRLDAIAIFTDGPLHTKHVELAMQHGKHAMSAVPAAWGSLDDCYFLRETVEKHKPNSNDGFATLTAFESSALRRSESEQGRAGRISRAARSFQSVSNC